MDDRGEATDTLVARLAAEREPIPYEPLIVLPTTHICVTCAARRV